VISLFKTTVVIQDARQTDFKEGEIDFITSNNTFEHIYPEILEGILKEFYRVLSPGGVMSHFIDMTDHFAHFDSSINVYNFLKFSPGFWKLIDNEILPQSRLRLKDYKSIYYKLNIPINDTVIWKHNPEQVRRVKVHDSWKDYTVEELAIVHVYLASKKNQ
jgi:ubiquinone/menaquinone biosynthesis C-methylase UbiE